MPAIERPGAEEFDDARAALDGVIVRTPLVPVTGERDLWIKPEVHQPAGSFKVRGVFTRVARMDPELRARGVSTVSAGNTAKALAWSARRFGVTARSLMPQGAPQTKVDAFRALGGEPILVTVDALFGFLKGRGWEQEPYGFVHPWIDRDVLVGHGSLGLEIVEELPDVDTVFIPVGGGGLFGGVAAALKTRRPDVRVVAVEPEGCPSFHAARQAGAPVDVSCDTICDGVAVPYMTAEMFPLLASLADEAVLVSEEEVRESIRFIAERCHLIAEGAAALTIAAARAMAPEQRGRTVCLITGGSIDASKLAAILEG